MYCCQFFKFHLCFDHSNLNITVNFILGCRSSVVNLEARSLSTWSTLRHCVIAHFEDLALEQLDKLLTQAGALLIILPRDFSKLSAEEKQVSLKFILMISMISENFWKQQDFSFDSEFCILGSLLAIKCFKFVWCPVRAFSLKIIFVLTLTKSSVLLSSLLKLNEFCLCPQSIRKKKKNYHKIGGKKSFVPDYAAQHCQKITYGP